MTVAFRNATPEDAPALDALFRTSFADTFGHLYDPADLAAFFAGFTPAAWASDIAELPIHVAERDGRLVGYAKMGPLTLPVTAAGPAMELRQLYLANDAKGAGIADALTDWTIATARAAGAGELFLSVFVDNPRAIRFYTRRGFTDVGRYQFRVGNHLDEDRLMRLTL